MWAFYGILAVVVGSLAAQPTSEATPEAQEAVKQNVTGQGHYWAPYGPPPPPPPPPPRRFRGFADDKNVCTLDATILIVLNAPYGHKRPPPPPYKIGASFDSPDGPDGPNVGYEEDDQFYDEEEGYDDDGPNVGRPPPRRPCHHGGHFGNRCGVTVRMRCSDVASMGGDSCTKCCQLASRFNGIRKSDIYGVLIDSGAIVLPPGPGPRGGWTGDSYRAKRGMPPRPPPPPPPGYPLPPPKSCAAQGIGCNMTKCMCCAPRRPWVPYFPPPPRYAPPRPYWGYGGYTGEAPPE